MTFGRPLKLEIRNNREIIPIVSDRLLVVLNGNNKSLALSHENLFKSSRCLKEQKHIESL